MIADLQDQLVQGPLEDDLFGRSVVIVPALETVRAGRFISQAVVVTTAARHLMTLSKDGEKLSSIVVRGGAHDPTKHPEFHAVSENLRELTNKWFPKAKLCLVTTSPLLERAQDRHALNFYDLPIVRLDAGTQKTFGALTGAKPGAFKELVDNLERLESLRLVIHTEFVRGDIDNSKDSEVKAWLRVMAGIKPASIRLSTPAKADKGRKPVTKGRLTEIEDLVAEKTGIQVEILS